MITSEIEFHAPTRVEEVLALLARHGPDAKILAGGMSLVPMMTLGLLAPERVISLNRVVGLDAIREEGDVLRIGARVRHAALRDHPLVRRHAPLLAEAAGFIGDPQIRNRGTIGGSLAHADPAADYLPVALALGARMRLQRVGGERVVAAADFFRDIMTTALEDGELLTEVLVPKLPPGHGSSYQRLHRVEGSFPIVAAAGIVAPAAGEARLALGGVGPVPVRLDVRAELAGGVTDAALDAVAARIADATPDAYGDLHADVAYRRAMAAVYARRVLRTAAARAARAGGAR